MEFEQLNLGANPNDSTGDPIRVGGQKSIIILNYSTRLDT